jgi:hypothetical protein
MDDSTPDDTGAAPTTVPGGRRAVILLVAVLVVIALVVAVILASRGAGGAGSASLGSDDDATVPAATSSPVTSQDPAEGQAPPAEAPEVDLDATAQPVPDVDVSLGGLEAVEGVADGPGEIAGPAISFTVTVENGTEAAVSLASTVVTVTSGEDLLPADQLATGSEPLPSEVPAGGTVTGTFVYTVPVERRDDVRITFDYLAGTPAVVFAGDVPRP